MLKKIGEIGVDSGQLMLVDPCYLAKWKDDSFNYKVGIRNKHNGREVFCWEKVEGVGVIDWQTPLPEFQGECMNSLADDKANWEMVKNYPDAGTFTYSGACGVSASLGHGVLDGGMGFVTKTRYGDGMREVYGEFDENNKLTKIIINL